MPRRARIAVAGIPWHIIQRGNNRTACFYTETDYNYFLDTLPGQSLNWRCEVHAPLTLFCLYVACSISHYEIYF